MGLISLLPLDPVMLRHATTDVFEHDVWLTRTREYIEKTYPELSCMYCMEELFVFADDSMDTASEHVRIVNSRTVKPDNASMLLADVTHMRGSVMIGYYKGDHNGLATSSPCFVSRRKQKGSTLRA